MTPNIFINNLRDISLPEVFNPYADNCEFHDLENAPAIRRNNLLSYLKTFDSGVDSIWFGRDLGYRGGRRTGLALTDENHLKFFRDVFTGSNVQQATKGPVVSERTATIVWRMLLEIKAQPFLWNVFPFHPHEPHAPLSNRRHTAYERDMCNDLLNSLISWLQPKKIIAIGNDAHHSISKLGYDCTYVRHPSYGGHNDFIKGITKIYQQDAITK